MFQVVSINTRQDVMVGISVLTGVVGSIAAKLVKLASVSILLNFTLSTKYCWKKNVDASVGFLLREETGRVEILRPAGRKTGQILLYCN